MTLDFPNQTNTAPALGRINLLIDGSGSMSGYFADRTEANHLRAVLSNLDSIIVQMKPASPDTRYLRVGKELREIAAADRTKITSRAFYTARCSPPANATCDYKESRLDNALKWAAEQPADELSIIISDLFLTAENGNPASPVALVGPLGVRTRK